MVIQLTRRKTTAARKIYIIKMPKIAQIYTKTTKTAKSSDLLVEKDRKRILRFGIKRKSVIENK